MPISTLRLRLKHTLFNLAWAVIAGEIPWFAAQVRRLDRERVGQGIPSVFE